MKILMLICDATFIRYFDRVTLELLGDNSKQILLLTRTQEWADLLRERYPQAMVELGYDFGIIEKFCPDLLFVGQIWWWGVVPVLMGARDLNIPILQFDHGALLSTSGYILDKEENHLEYRSNIALCSHIAVWGQRPKEAWVSYGVLQEKFLVTGAPHLDCLYELQTQPRKDIHALLGIPKSKKIIFMYTVVTGQSKKYDDYCLELISHVEQFVASNQGFQLIIKPHPSEMIWFDRMQYQAAPDTIVVAHLAEDCIWDTIIRAEVDEIVYNSDVVIGMSSSSMITPIILNKPFIHFEMDDCLSHDIAHFGNNFHYNISNPSHVGNAIYEAINNESYDSSRIAKELNFNNDGKSTKRVIEAIEQILDERNSGRKFYISIEDEFIEGINRYPFLPYPYKSLIEYYCRQGNMLAVDEWLSEYCRRFSDPIGLCTFLAFICFQKSDYEGTLKYLVLHNKYKPLSPDLLHMYKMSLLGNDMRTAYA